MGSGNVGATNVGRVLGRRLGITCFVLDVAKGAVPVLAYAGAIGGLAALRTEGGAGAAGGWLAVAAAAVAGHVFPIWLAFRGGKGVATSLGVVLGFWPVLTVPGLAAMVLWLAVVLATGYVSLASVLAAVVLPPLAVLASWWLELPTGVTLIFFGVTSALAALVVVRHRTNLSRLRAGTEGRAQWASRWRRRSA